MVVKGPTDSTKSLPEPNVDLPSVGSFAIYIKVYNTGNVHESNHYNAF